MRAAQITKQERKPAFTLIELLVVIAVIAILAAMLMPALNAAKGNVNTVSCKNNLKNLFYSFQQYADDYDSWSPYAKCYSDPNAGYWMDYYAREKKLKKRGLFDSKPYASSVFLCPAHTNCYQTAVKTSYGINLHALVDWTRFALTGSPGGQAVNSLRIHKIKHPSQTCWFGDSSGASSISIVNAQHPFRHRGATNLMFFEGHADTRPPSRLPNMKVYSHIDLGTLLQTRVVTGLTKSNGTTFNNF